MDLATQEMLRVGETLADEQWLPPSGAAGSTARQTDKAKFSQCPQLSPRIMCICRARRGCSWVGSLL